MAGSLRDVNMPGDFLGERLDTIAARLTDGCVTYAERSSMNISAIILDVSFSIIGARRMDQATPHSFDLAFAKAYTALDYRARTAEVGARLSAEAKVALSIVNPRLFFIAGGAPIEIGGKVVGSIGVSGGLPDQDAECVESVIGVVLGVHPS